MNNHKSGMFIASTAVLAVCAVYCVTDRIGARDTIPTLQAHWESVVLLHGLGRTTASMTTLEERLEEAGFDVVNWGYASTRDGIEGHGRSFHELLVKLDADPAVRRIHVVGHSLGGIVARYALTIETPGKLGRMVMLAPPNRGSSAARKWAPILGNLIKPLEQLSDDPNSAVNQIAAPSGLTIGVIAAAQDGKVDLEDTHLPGETSHLTVPGYHTFIMNRADVAKQVICFLRNGCFDRPDKNAAQTQELNDVDPR